MQKLIIALCSAVAPLLTDAAEARPEAAGAAEVVDRVNEAVELLAARGERALPALAAADGRFVWKDTYVFVVDCERDRVVVNPAFPERVGGDIKQHVDYAGYAYGKELCRIAQNPAGGWLDYVWLRPGEDKPLRKRSYVRAVPGQPYQVGAGIYIAGAAADE